MLNALRIAFAVYYGAMVFVAIWLPNESPVFMAMRVLAILLSFGIVWFGDDVVSFLFGGVRLESRWWIFVPLTLYFSIAFGVLCGMEYRLLLRRELWP
jgi:hypothetical protein